MITFSGKSNQSGKYLAIDGPFKGATISLNESLESLQIKRGNCIGFYEGLPGGISDSLLVGLNIHPRMKAIYKGRAKWRKA